VKNVRKEPAEPRTHVDPVVPDFKAEWVQGGLRIEPVLATLRILFRTSICQSVAT
jgi:hypothetical protein